MAKQLTKHRAILALLFCSSAAVHAEQYLTEDEALALAFEKPKAVRRVDLPNREPMAEDTLKVFVGELKGGKGRGAVFFDAVIGKHQPIDYMLVVNSTGEILRIEVLEYRETYGGQVREETWRNQFMGKNPRNPPKHDEDIHNIAGATLSCRHVTEGVAKLLKIFHEKRDELLGKSND